MKGRPRDDQSKEEQGIYNNRIPQITTYELGEALIRAAASNKVAELESLTRVLILIFKRMLGE